MKVVVFEAEKREREAFGRLRPVQDVIFVDDPLKASNVKDYADAEIVSTFIYSELSRDIIEQLPKLKMIATRSTGFEHINTALCAERGILVSNVPTYGSNTVAEHIFALLLSISHRMPEAIERAQRGISRPSACKASTLRARSSAPSAPAASGGTPFRSRAASI